MNIKSPNWTNKTVGSIQSPEEMNKLVEVIQNHYEVLTDQQKQIVATSGGLYPGRIIPSSSRPADITSGVFLVATPGTYTNFGNVVLPAADATNAYIGLIFWNGSSFSISTVPIPLPDATGNVALNQTSKAVNGDKVYRHTIQKSFTTFDPDILSLLGGYNQYAIVYHLGKMYISTKAANMSTPGTNTDWQEIKFSADVDQEFNKDSLNAPSARAINNVVFGKSKIEIKTDITSTVTIVANKIINPISFVIQDNTSWDYLKIAVVKNDEFYYETNGGAESTSQNIVFQADSNDVINEVVGVKTTPSGISEEIKIKATEDGFLYFNKRKMGFSNPFAKIYRITYENSTSEIPSITQDSLWEEVYKNYALKKDVPTKTKVLNDLDLLKSYTPTPNRLIDSNNVIQTATTSSSWRNIFVYELLKGRETVAKVKLSVYPNSSTAKTLLAIKTNGSVVSLLDHDEAGNVLTEREIVIPSDTLYLSVTQITANLSNIYIKINGTIDIVNNNVKNTSIHSEREILPIKANGQFNWNSYSAHQSNIVVDKLGNEYLCIVNENKYVNVLKKDAITKEWSVYNFQGKNPNPFAQTIDDNHNVYSISINKDGYILLTGNMHANPCKSVRSANPYDITSWVVCNYTTANVTYPRFVKDIDEKVYLFWREGGSGAGDTYYCYFDDITLKYSSKVQLTEGDSVSVNAYEQRVVIGSDNSIHYCYCVRGSSASANTNVGMYYMKSNDGINWETEKNTALILPITHNVNGNRVFNAEVNSGLVNQNGSCVDGNNNFHTVFWQYRENGFTQIIHLWYDGLNWRSEQLTDYNFRIDLSSGGLLGNLSRPQIIYSKSTNKVFAMYRTSEMNEGGQIHFIDVTTKDKISVGNFVLGQMELQYYQDDESLKMIVHDMALKDGSLTLKSNNTYLLRVNI